MIDDDPTILELLEATMGGGSNEVLLAAEADEGVAMVRASAVDLLVLDLDLPGGDGRQVVEELRGLGSQIPIIVLTGSGRARERELLSAGAQVYLTKPFSPIELVGRVEAMLGAPRREP